MRAKFIVILCLTLSAAACFSEKRRSNRFRSASHRKDVASEPATSTQAAPREVVVPTTIIDGRATAQLQPSNDTVQVVPAAPDSAIAGSRVEFPPGSIALATDITVMEGENIATNAVVSALSLGSGLASVAPSVAVVSSVAIDTSEAFTVSLPLPANASGLSLQGDDAFAKLAVLYRIQDVAAQQERMGYVTRTRLEVRDRLVRFETRHFGTYQAVFTKDVLPEQAKELLAEVVDKLTDERRVFFVKGPSGVISDQDGVSGGPKMPAWLYGMTAGSVKSDTFRLQTGVVSKVQNED